MFDDTSSACANEGIDSLEKQSSHATAMMRLCAGNRQKCLSAMVGKHIPRPLVRCTKRQGHSRLGFATSSLGFALRGHSGLFLGHLIRVHQVILLDELQVTVKLVDEWACCGNVELEDLGL